MAGLPLTLVWALTLLPSKKPSSAVALSKVLTAAPADKLRTFKDSVLIEIDHAYHE